MLLPKDYIRYRLSGTYATEVSDASGTLLARRRQSPLEPRTARASSTSTPPSCRVVSRAPRSPRKVSAIGADATRAWRWERRSSAAAATSQRGRSATGSFARGSSRRRWGPRASSSPTPIELGFDPLGRLQRGCHAVPGPWHVMGVVLSAGGSFQWFRNELGKAEIDRGQGPGGRPLFPPHRRGRARGGRGRRALLPALSDRRTNPALRPRRQGAWVGLTVRHGRAHMIRSVLEGATYAMRDSLELIREMGVAMSSRSGFPAEVRGTPLWRQIQADIYGHRRPHAELDRRSGVRRRASGAGRHRRLRERSRSLRRHDPARRADAGRPHGEGVLRPRLCALSPTL